MSGIINWLRGDDKIAIMTLLQVTGGSVVLPEIVMQVPLIGTRRYLAPHFVHLTFCCPKALKLPRISLIK